MAASSNTPIQYEVGEAILEYLRNERPRCVWHVFVTMQLPYRPVGPGGLWGIIGKTYEADQLRLRVAGNIGNTGDERMWG